MLILDEKNEYIGIDENGFLENEELNYHYNTFNIENLTDSIEVNLANAVSSAFLKSI